MDDHCKSGCFFLLLCLIAVFFPIANSGESNPLTGSEEELGLEVAIQEPAKVILYNDEVHTFEEVIGQIIKATGCDFPRAEALTWEVHTRGKAMVYVGEMNRCVEVSGILEEIELMTQIEV